MKGLDLPRYLGILGFLSVVLPYLYLLYLILLSAPNVPVGDAWEAFRPDALGSPTAWNWAFTRHNDHPIVPTKALEILLFWWNGFSLRQEAILSYLIYGVMLLVFVAVLRRAYSRLPLGILAGFLLAFVTTALICNHTSGYNSQYHFVGLFKWSALLLLFSQGPAWLAVLPAVALLIATMFSFGSGLAAAITIATIYLLYQWRLGQCTGSAKKNLLPAGTLAGSVLLVAALTSESIRIKFSDGNLSLPTEQNFWFMFAKLAGAGLSFPDPSMPTAISAIALLLAVPLAWLSLRAWRAPEATNWMLLAGAGATIAELFSITAGRAQFHDVDSFVSGRYCEISFFLIPWAALAWAKLLDRTKLQIPFLLAFWTLMAFNLRGYWGFIEYPGLSRYYEEQAGCLRDYYLKGTSGDCKTLYPYPFTDKLDHARAVNASFYRELVNNPPKAFD